MLLLRMPGHHGRAAELGLEPVGRVVVDRGVASLVSPVEHQVRVRVCAHRRTPRDSVRWECLLSCPQCRPRVSRFLPPVVLADSFVC